MAEEYWLVDEAATLAAGKAFSKQLTPGITVYLQGQLGAGKTTFTKGVLRGLGHSGSVKSPTYTLVEPYETLSVAFYHFDLYRLGDAEELDYIGIRDYFDAESICLIEWPEKGQGFLPEANLWVELQAEAGETGTIGRRLTIRSEK